MMDFYNDSAERSSFPVHRREGLFLQILIIEWEKLKTLHCLLIKNKMETSWRGPQRNTCTTKAHKSFVLIINLPVLNEKPKPFPSIMACFLHFLSLLKCLSCLSRRFAACERETKRSMWEKVWISALQLGSIASLICYRVVAGTWGLSKCSFWTFTSVYRPHNFYCSTKIRDTTAPDEDFHLPASSLSQFTGGHEGWTPFQHCLFIYPHPFNRWDRLETFP